jgi:AP-5 complex subunit beta-1, beta-barrel
MTSTPREWSASEWYRRMQMFRQSEERDRDKALGYSGHDILDGICFVLRRGVESQEAPEHAFALHLLKLNLLLFARENIFMLAADANTVQHLCVTVDKIARLYEHAANRLYRRHYCSQPESSTSNNANYPNSLDSIAPAHVGETLHFLLSMFGALLQCLASLFCQIDLARRNPALLDAFVHRLCSIVCRYGQLERDRRFDSSAYEQQQRQQSGDFDDDDDDIDNDTDADNGSDLLDGEAKRRRQRRRTPATMSIEDFDLAMRRRVNSRRHRSSGGDGGESLLLPSAAAATTDSGRCPTIGQTRLLRQAAVQALEELENVYPLLLAKRLEQFVDWFDAERTHVAHSFAALLLTATKNATIEHGGDGSLCRGGGGADHQVVVGTERLVDFVTAGSLVLPAVAAAAGVKFSDAARKQFYRCLSAVLDAMASAMTTWGVASTLETLAHLATRLDVSERQRLAVAIKQSAPYALWCSLHAPLRHATLLLLEALPAGMVDAHEQSVIEQRLLQLLETQALCGSGGGVEQQKALLDGVDYWQRRGDAHPLHAMALDGAVDELHPSIFDAPVIVALKFRLLCRCAPARAHFRLLHMRMRDFELYPVGHARVRLFFHLVRHCYDALDADECVPVSHFLIQLLGLSTKFLRPVVGTLLDLMVRPAARADGAQVVSYLLALVSSLVSSLPSGRLQHYLPLLLALARVPTMSAQLIVAALTSIVRHPSFEHERYEARSLVLSTCTALVQAQPSIEPVYDELARLLRSCARFERHLDFVDQANFVHQLLTHVRQSTMQRILTPPDLLDDEETAGLVSSSYTTRSSVRRFAVAFLSLSRLSRLDADVEPRWRRQHGAAASPLRVFLPIEIGYPSSSNKIEPSAAASTLSDAPSSPSSTSVSALPNQLYALVVQFRDVPSFFAPIEPIRIACLAAGGTSFRAMVSIEPRLPMPCTLPIHVAFTSASGETCETRLPSLAVRLADLMLAWPDGGEAVPLSLPVNVSNTFAVPRLADDMALLDVLERCSLAAFVVSTRDERHAQLAIRLPPRYSVVVDTTLERRTDVADDIVTCAIACDFWPCLASLTSFLQSSFSQVNGDV